MVVSQLAQAFVGFKTNTTTDVLGHDSKLLLRDGTCRTQFGPLLRQAKGVPEAQF